MARKAKTAKAPAKPKNPPGPDALRVKSDLSFEEAVRVAMNKKKPAAGWPDPPPSGRYKRGTKPKKR